MKYIWKCLLCSGCRWKRRVFIAVNFQFKQLEGRSLKNIRASTGLEPVTSATPVRCSTNWAVRPHIGSEISLLSSCLLVHGFESRWSPVIFRLLPSNCLNWKFTVMVSRSSLSSTTTVQYAFHIYFTSFHCTGKINVCLCLHGRCDWCSVPRHYYFPVNMKLWRNLRTNVFMILLRP